LAIIASFLILLFLVNTMKKLTAPEPLGERRAKERIQALQEINAANTEALKSYGWVDKTKGIVQLPIDRAIELTLQQAKDPAAIRGNLRSRIEEATKPVSFE
jgi:hypothetical protein